MLPYWRPSNAITPRSCKAPGIFYGGLGRAAITGPIREPSSTKTIVLRWKYAGLPHPSLHYCPSLYPLLIGWQGTAVAVKTHLRLSGFRQIRKTFPRLHSLTLV